MTKKKQEVMMRSLSEAQARRIAIRWISDVILQRLGIPPWENILTVIIGKIGT